TCGGCAPRMRRLAEVSQRQFASLSALTASINCLVQASSGSWSAPNASIPVARMAFMTRDTIRTGDGRPVTVVVQGGTSEGVRGGGLARHPRAAQTTLLIAGLGTGLILELGSWSSYPATWRGV